jgi:hypothetical protein
MMKTMFGRFGSSAEAGTARQARRALLRMWVVLFIM